MNIIYLIGLIILFLLLIFINYKYLNLKNKYFNILIIYSSICTTILLRTNYSKEVMNEQIYVYIPFAIITMLMVWSINFKIQNIKLSLDNIIVLIIILSMLIFLCTNKIENTPKFMQMLWIYISIILIGSIYKNMGKYDVDKVMNFISYIAIGNGALAIVQFVLNKKLLPGMFNITLDYSAGGLPSVKRAVGFAITNNAAGNFSVILFAAVLYNYLNRKSKVNLLALVLTCIFSLLTFTRTGYLGIIIVLFVFTILYMKDGIKEKIVGIKSDFKKIRSKYFNTKLKLYPIVTILLLSFCWIMYKLYDILVVKRGNTLWSRFDQYNRSFEIFLQHPFIGIGAGQYKVFYYNHTNVVDIDIHSQYLNILVEQGIVIAILFFILNIYILYKGIAKCEKKLQKTFLIAIFIGNFICSNVIPNQDYLINNFMYYMIMYCFVYNRKVENKI